MVIVYCEKCNRRVPDAALADGRAVQLSENNWLCESCAPQSRSGAAHTTKAASAIPTSSTKTTVPIHAPPARRGGTSQFSRLNASAAAPKAESSSNKLIIGLAVAGICLLGAGIVLSRKKSSPIEPPVAAASAPPEVIKEKPRETKVAVASTQTVNLEKKAQPSMPAGNVTAPPSGELTNAERIKQADKEMEEYRYSRAAKLLEEHQEWFKQNPTDPWSYQSKLQDIVRSYASAPAGIEAKRLLSEMKPLPPQPDRFDLVPESKDYQLVYDLDLGRLGENIAYGVDNRSKVTQPFDRVAYFMELQPASGEVQYVFVSMDAFTNELGKIGVPTVASGARFQQNVTNMNVFSNVKSVVTGTGLAGGNIEFWPNNYGPQNAQNVPNASSQAYDFGDVMADPPNGHGCMQVHNHDAKQTVFALNQWRGGGEMGIGNSPFGNPDWTFAGNAGAYRMKRLRVLVHCK